MATKWLSMCFRFLVLSMFFKLSLANKNEGRTRKDVLRLSRHCSTPKVRLDQYDSVVLSSYTPSLQDAVIPGNLTCKAHYRAGNTDQGICVEKMVLHFKNMDPGFEVKFFTTRFGPEKAFNSFHNADQFDEWCTKESMVSIELTSLHGFQNMNDDYDLKFRVTNVSRDSIDKHYRMDSFKDCNQEQVLKSGEVIELTAHEYPAPSDLPASCLLTFSTTSEEEYDEVCLRTVKSETMTSCLSNLNITGFDTSFWAWSEILGCNDTHTKLKAGNEMCSNSKTLTLNLTRTSTTDTGFKFSGVITVKKHPRWQTISQEKSELRGLAFIKGVTYFVAAIDSLAGIMAAILASMFRNPRSFWKSWAESVNVPEKCEAVHYEDSCTAVTSSNSKIEEVMEVKSY